MSRPPIDLRQHPILYVDDEASNLKAFQYVFGSEFTVLTATCGEEALRLLCEQDVAVLVADQRMPGMTGVEICERAVTLAPHTTRIILTAYADVNAAQEAINRGRVERYVEKPFRAAELASVLRAAIEVRHTARAQRALCLALLVDGPAKVATALYGEVHHELGNVASVLSVHCDLLGETLDEMARAAEREARPFPEPLARALELHGVLDLAVGQLRGFNERLRPPDDPKNAGDNRCNPAEVVTVLATFLRRLIVPSAALEVESECGRHVAMAPSALGQVLINLVRNAAEAMGGLPPDRRRIGVRVSDLRERIVIRVSDTGPGVPPELRQRVFDRAFTTKAWGNGLGLAIARKLVHAADGEIAVGEAPGGGALVEISLPPLSS